MKNRWTELDHTADIAISVTGENLASLFTTAAHALFTLAYEPGHRTKDETYPVILTAPDVESLLIDWLNELLYLSEKHDAYFYDFTVRSLTVTTLSIECAARDILETRRGIKAATFHNIAVKETASGFETVIVFDT